MSLSISAVVFDTATPGESVERFLQAFRATPGRERVPFIVITGAGVRRRLAASPQIAECDAVLERPVRPATLLRHVERMLALQDAAGALPSPVRLDRRRQTVHAGLAWQRLTPTEFRLLACLLDHAGQTLTYDQLLERVWGYAPETGSHELVRTHIMNLRRKLSRLPGAGTVIQTVSGLGYQLRVVAEAAEGPEAVPPYWAADAPSRGHEGRTPSLTEGETVGVE
jgi:DNA-binding response OmpR family regulator